MTLSDETKQKIYEDFEQCKDKMYGTLTEKERKKLGAFYTPPQLVIKMIEKFENLEGDICKIKDIVYDDNIYVKENIIILYSVFSILFNKVKDNLKKVIKDNNISELNPVLKIQENYSISDNLALFNNIKIKNNIVKNYTINSTLYNFYANDNISNASQIMSNCNKSLVKRSNY